MAFPDGKITITEKQDSIGSLTFYSGPEYEYYEWHSVNCCKTKGK